MKTAEFQMPDGRIAEFDVPEDFTEEQATAFMADFFAQQQEPQEAAVEGIGPPNPGQGVTDALQTVGRSLTGAAEVAATLATGAFAEPVAGIAGLVSQVTGGDGTQTINDTREALTFQPRTDEGQAQLGAVGDFLAPAVEKFQEAEKGLGDAAFDATGSPAAGAAATALPTALLELLGVAGARSSGKAAARIRDIAKSVPDERVSSILATAKKTNTPVLTTDLFPPEGFIGKTIKNISEKLGPLGTGNKRAAQQRARIEAASGIADNIDIDSPFANKIVSSLDGESTKRMRSAGRIRDEAITALDTYGEFPAERAINSIDNILAEQKRLGATGNSTINTEMLNFQEELLKPSDFSMKKDLRSQLIKKRTAASRAEDVAPVAAFQKVKAALDKDMVAFARENDRGATKKWLSSNRAFANEMEVTRRTELKRILDGGEATPEKVIQILRGGKPSELKRLHDSLGANGRVAAKKALLQQALKDAGFFKVDAAPNPDAIATALNRPAFQQASKVFFSDSGKAELEGITRLLDVTREAQRSQAMLQTGQQLLLPSLAGAAGALAGTGTVSPGILAAAIGTGSALIKAYESKAFRNILIKISSAKKGAPIPPRLLDAAGTALVAAGPSFQNKQQENEEGTE